MASVAGGLTAPREAPRKGAIKRVELQPGQDGDQIFVVVRVEHASFFPDCSLTEARTKDVHGKPLSPWYDEDATETALIGSSYVYVFYEDPHPSGKVADPRKTAYYVLCAVDPSGRVVEAHVEGTPEASP